MSAPSGSPPHPGNLVNIQFIRPANGKILSCVYYIHGGGIATMSRYYGNYRAWGRMIAAQGVAVAMVDFRNAVRASTAPEVAPYPAGLNDCVSGLKWVYANAEKLSIDTSLAKRSAKVPRMAGADRPNSASFGVMRHLGMHFHRKVQYPLGAGAEYRLQRDDPGPIPRPTLMPLV